MLEPVRPDYEGASVARIVPALLGAADGSWLPAPAAAASAVVLLVLDGLAWDAIRARPDLVPTLRSMEGAAITTAVPSTTGTALTSITTGRAPAEHGMVGFRMAIGGGVLNVLRWDVAGNGRRPDPARVQPIAPFLGRSVPVVTKTEFNQTPFSLAHMRGARIVGWRTATMLVHNCRALVASGERFVYAYYDGIDVVAHARGLRDPAFDAELAFTDRLVADLLSVLPDSVALLVTADHGQVHLHETAWISVDEVGALVRQQAGDARFRFLYADGGAERELLAACEERFGERAWIFSRERLLDEGWLGPARASSDVRARIGDVILAARDDIAFVDPSLPYETTLRSGHGSLTPAEMLVPLLGSRGRA